jgi:hypothetical protein
VNFVALKNCPRERAMEDGTEGESVAGDYKDKIVY